MINSKKLNKKTPPKGLVLNSVIVLVQRFMSECDYCDHIVSAVSGSMIFFTSLTSRKPMHIFASKGVFP